MAAVLFAPSIKRTQQLNEALADVAQLGYGVESAYGCGLVVTYCQLCGFDFQSLVLNEVADESQFFNVFGCVKARAALAALGAQSRELALPKAQGRLRFADDVGYIADFVV